METLNYEVLKKSGYDGYILRDAPEKVLQFGEGNFLRAFVDYWFDLANEKAGWNGKCVLVQPIAPGLAKMINEQEGLYTLYLRGSENGRKVDDKRVISSVSRCLNPYEKEDYEKMMAVAASDDLEIIVSNTTEAGIVYDPACQKDDCPPSSFPAKLTQVLYHRYQAGKKGILMLACELIDDNGKQLLKCVNQYIDQWGLEDGFKKYVNEECTFCGSLVDRIVPGRIRDPKEVGRTGRKERLCRPADRRGRSVRRLGHRGRPQTQRCAAFPQGGAGIPRLCHARHEPLQEAQGAHPQRRAHRLRCWAPIWPGSTSCGTACMTIPS